MQVNPILLDRIEQLERAIAEIQKSIVKSKEEKPNDIPVSVPNNYMNLECFCKSFPFISSAQLGKWIRECPDYFKPIRSGRLVFIDPISVVAFTLNPPHGVKKSAKINNALFRMKDLSVDISDLYSKWWTSKNSEFLRNNND